MTTTTSTRPSSTTEPTPSTGTFTTSYRALVAALKTLALPTTGRKSLPVLTRVQATIRTGHLVLTTFDFDTAVTVAVPATGTTAGVMLLDHPSITKILAAAAKGLSKASADRLEITVTTPDHTPVVHTNGYSLPLDDTVPVDAFPQLPATTPSTHVIDRHELVALVDRVTVAADRGDTLPILTGILAELDKGTLTLTATDRYRLASGTITVHGTSTEKVLIPAAALSKLLPRLTSPQTRMGVDVIDGTTWVTVADDNTTIRMRTLDGEYPKVSSILHQEPTRSLTLPRAALLQAATRAASLSAAVKATNSPVMITANRSELTVAPATVGDRTKVTAPSLPVTVVGETDEWVTGANPAFLLAAIATLSAEEVTLHLTDPSRPMVLTDADSTDYRHVLMPVRVAQ